ncbi:MAG: flagellar biosynthesis anti-sigma factor FlgM [Pseudomonadales bacterium]|jgi:negative regulator of flagellin synthesis FlgM|nr:flagellar biosynthesis anti-sigma factor FlgM [Pseudomonadales bacterium]MDA0959135.1 flagellar biosynthesis anti-sigma factor FlgM [Pseudomonadota bacterium]MDA1206908.1 flagellar biosynthesis anti-sigma factor FlgM [Pseudomonadota bacterium]
MAMDIKPTQTGVTQTPTQKPMQAKAAADLSNRATKTDTVTVTTAAEDLIEMEKQLSSLSNADDARIANIKAQVQAGSFQIDSAKIAEKLIEQETDLL